MEIFTLQEAASFEPANFPAGILEQESFFWLLDGSTCFKSLMTTHLVSASQFLVLGRRFVAAHKSQTSPVSPHGLPHSSSARNSRSASHESIDLDGFIVLASFVGWHGDMAIGTLHKHTICITWHGCNLINATWCELWFVCIYLYTHCKWDLGHIAM